MLNKIKMFIELRTTTTTTKTTKWKLLQRNRLLSLCVFIWVWLCEREFKFKRITKKTVNRYEKTVPILFQNNNSWKQSNFTFPTGNIHYLYLRHSVVYCLNSSGDREGDNDDMEVSTIQLVQRNKLEIKFPTSWSRR